MKPVKTKRVPSTTRGGTAIPTDSLRAVEPFVKMLATVHHLSRRQGRNKWEALTETIRAYYEMMTDESDTKGRHLQLVKSVDRSGCMEVVCTCHDDGAWVPGRYPAGCLQCGCRWAD